MFNKKARYYIDDMAKVLKEFSGFDERKYNLIVDDPPVPLWEGLLKPLRFFQWLIGDEGYSFKTFKLGDIRVDFYYYYDRSINSIIIKGKRRRKNLFKHGTLLGNIARKIAREHRVAFCHTYTIYHNYYGLHKIVRDYAYVRRADPSNLKEKIESIMEADKSLTRLVNEHYLNGD